MQQLTTELDTQVNKGGTANEQLQKLKGEASVLQLWQQNVQAERAAEIEAVKTARQVNPVLLTDCLVTQAITHHDFILYVCPCLRMDGARDYQVDQSCRADHTISERCTPFGTDADHVILSIVCHLVQMLLVNAGG